MALFIVTRVIIDQRFHFRQGKSLNLSKWGPFTEPKIFSVCCRVLLTGSGSVARERSRRFPPVIVHLKNCFAFTLGNKNI